MAIDPFEHVMDVRGDWSFFDTLGVELHLPPHLSKFMILETVAAVVIVALFVPLARRVQSGEPVRGWGWNALESLLTFIRNNVAKPCINEHDVDRFLPFLWTIFLFVLTCNLLGLFPFMASPTASITVTATLAFFSALAIHGGAIAKLGLPGYLKSYVPHMDVPFGLGYVMVPMMVVIEVAGAFIKVGVLAVRLFANMFGGHTVLAVMLLFIVLVRQTGWFVPVTLASVTGVVLLSLLELFVAFLQAFIFVFLTAIFIGSALHPQH
jgi:F-type H+-transporting ATPase subunit a